MIFIKFNRRSMTYAQLTAYLESLTMERKLINARKVLG